MDVYRLAAKLASLLPRLLYAYFPPCLTHHSCSAFSTEYPHVLQSRSSSCVLSPTSLCSPLLIPSPLCGSSSPKSKEHLPTNTFVVREILANLPLFSFNSTFWLLPVPLVDILSLFLNLIPSRPCHGFACPALSSCSAFATENPHLLFPSPHVRLRRFPFSKHPLSLLHETPHSFLRHETTVMKFLFQPLKSLRRRTFFPSILQILPLWDWPFFQFWNSFQHLFIFVLINKGLATIQPFPSQLHTGVASTFATPHHNLPKPSTVPAAPLPQQVVKCFANPSEAPARSRNVCMFAALPASQDLERPLQIIALSSPVLPLPSFMFSTNCHDTFPFGTISSLSFLFSTCKCKFAANSHPR